MFDIIELYKNIVEKAEDGILVLDSSFIILFSNKSAFTMLKGVEQTDDTYIFGELFPLDIDIMTELETTNRYESNDFPIYTRCEEIEDKKGVANIIIKRVGFNYNNNYDYVFFVYMKDITKQKLMEDKREELRLSQLEITQEAQVRQWKDMLIDINHETRSALSALLNIFDTLNIYFNNMNTKYNECNKPGKEDCCVCEINTIIGILSEGRNATERIKFVLNTMADNARAKATVTSELFNVVEEIEKEIKMIKRYESSESARVIIILDKPTMETPIIVDMVRFQFQMIIKNLLENAIKACTEKTMSMVGVEMKDNIQDGSNEIYITIVKNNKSEAKIIIADTGIGMPEHIRDNLGTDKYASLFKTGENRGMKIIKAFCANNGISLKVKSKYMGKVWGKYATVFELTFNIVSVGDICSKFNKKKEY